jgi:hypothetical protein
VLWRPATGEWLVRFSRSNYDLNSWQLFNWGGPGDSPVIVR